MGRRFLLLTALLALIISGFSQKGYVKRADRLMSEFLFADAAQLYKREIKADTNDLLSKEKLIHAYLILGKVTDAESVCRKLVATPLANAENWFKHGQILCMQGRYIDAGYAFQKFVELKPRESRSEEFKSFADTINSLKVDNKAYELYNMPVNSDASEIGPFYYNDKLNFASNLEVGTGMKVVDEWTGKGFYDLYVQDSIGVVAKV